MKRAFSYFVISSFASCAVFPAYATMPLLTEKPASPNQTSCEKWAAEQDDDAIEMWGIQDSGISSRTAALRRLARSCLGKRQPSIVGFGSSVGFDDAYCEQHKTAQVCKKNASFKGIK